MFQAQEVAPGFQRPVIMHAYGGAKADMEKAWRPLPLRDGYQCRHAGDREQTANVGKCGAPPGSGYHH